MSNNRTPHLRSGEFETAHLRFHGLVYENILGSEFNLAKGLNLSGLKRGSYTIVLYSPEKEFSYNSIK